MKNDQAKIRRIAAVGVLLLTTIVTACNVATEPDTRSSDFEMLPATYSNSTIDFKALYPKLSTQVPSKSTKGDTTIQKWTVNPKDGKLIVFGKTSGDVIAIPANTLCDPIKNTYGPSEWLKPCVLAGASISFEARTWNDAAGRPHASFTPALRFNPSAPVPVRLYFKDATLGNFSQVYIPYCNAFRVCVNEGLTDAALTTYVSPLTGGGYWVYRTLRHFSGYSVTAD